VERLGLSRNVLFPGYLERRELRALYRASTLVVHPSLYEAMSGPLLEAWQEGVPAAAAAITSIPEQAAGAALLFNPLEPGPIAAAMRRLLEDGALRSEMVRRGRERLRHYSWEGTAQAYQRLYRQVADVHSRSVRHEAIVNE
jgi:glycosyltransferase involved in cell wall biosynthesis